MPSPQPVTWTVKDLLAEPSIGSPIAQPVAVPVTDRSPAVNPMIPSSNESVAVSVGAFVGLAGRVTTACGAVRSMWTTGPAVAIGRTRRACRR